MARTLTPKPPAGTPGPFDPAALLALMQAQGETLTAINQRCARIEAQMAQASDRQADADKRLDDRLTARLAPVLVRLVSSMEAGAKLSAEMKAEIREAGEEARREMVRTSRMAKLLMEKVETAAFTRMQTMQDGTVEIAESAKAAMTQKVEEIQAEAVTLMEGMRNAAVSEVGRLGASIEKKVARAGDLAASLIQNAATTAQAAITSTASTAEAEYVKATAKAKAAFDLSKACVQSFEASMAELRRIGPWLGHTIERRTWQIAGATGVSAVAATGIALLLFRGVLWATGGAL